MSGRRATEHHRNASRRARTAAALAVGLILALAACDSGDSGDSAADKTPSSAPGTASSPAPSSQPATTAAQQSSAPPSATRAPASSSASSPTMPRTPNGGCAGVWSAPHIQVVGHRVDGRRGVHLTVVDGTWQCAGDIADWKPTGARHEVTLSPTVTISANYPFHDTNVNHPTTLDQFVAKLDELVNAGGLPMFSYTTDPTTHQITSLDQRWRP